MNNFLFVLFLISVNLLSCTTRTNTTVEIPQEKPEINHTEIQEIRMQIHPDIYKKVPEKIDLEIANKTPLPVQFGAHYQIEKFDTDTDQWKELIFTEGIAFIDILYELDSGAARSYEIYLYPVEGDYTPGRYRVKKSFFVNEKRKDFYACFTIE